MKRGPKSKPNTAELSGRNRPERKVVSLFGKRVASSADLPVPPDDMEDDEARADWVEFLNCYLERGQRLDRGLRKTFIHYVELGVALKRIWRSRDHEGNREIPSMSMLNAYRGYANEFFDTPASQFVRVGRISNGEKESKLSGLKDAVNG